MPYAANSALVTKAAGFADFFTPLYTATCGTITACTLKVSGCGSAYSTGNLAISSVGVVTAKQNVDAGYEDTVCISCSNSHGSTVEHDSWKVTQAPNCATLTAGSLTDKVYDYDAGATTTTVYAFTDVFTNSKTSACPVTSCTLKQSDCSTALVAPFDSLMTIEGSTPWTFKISQAQASGYPNVVVCYSCTNSGHTVDKQITIRQKINCAIALNNATTTIKSYADPASGS